MKIGQKVGMFKGRCPTKNLFSMIDPACEGQQMKFIESIYKDGAEEYILWLIDLIAPSLNSIK